MRIFRTVLLIILLLAGGVVAWVFLPDHVTLQKQTLNVTVNEQFDLVGYRAISTNPDADTQFHYFIVTQDSDIKTLEPFLITSDPFVRLERAEENTVSLTINGRIYQYHNDVWVKKNDGKLHHWYVSANTRYLR